MTAIGGACYACDMNLSHPERENLRSLANRIKSEFGAKRVILFGSAVRGEMDAGSDIDLMIVLPAVDWEIEKAIGNLAFDAGLEIDRIISIACFSVDDLAAGPMRASPLIHNINREGMVL